jgi:hypothetical protein
VRRFVISLQAGLRLAALVLAVLAAGAVTSATSAGDASTAAQAVAVRPLQDGVWLVMVEAADCGWCRRWHKEIGPAYPTSDEGRQAPLDRRERGDPVLAGLGPVIYTPTFILVHDGREVDRLVGYPGVLYFWTELDTMLGKLRPAADPGTRAEVGGIAGPG